MSKVSLDVIEQFLEGRDNQKYIVGIEAPYHENKVYLIINDPIKGKRIEIHSYEPFLWIKHEVSQLIYNGDRNLIRKKLREYDVKIKGLKISNEHGYTPKRLDDGFKYLVSCAGSYNKLLSFFKDGGIDVFSDEYKHLFMRISPDEQFMIQTGKRLFKGMEDYDDLHRLQFDLETTGLDPKKDAIFQIGIRDNRGFEEVIEVRGDNPKELRDREKAAIIKFFLIIDQLKPDLITAYNSESFDWDFIFQRCDRLSLDIKRFAKTLSNAEIKRKDATLKLGNETEHYQQTLMWGYNILDIAHAVRRAQAINSDIKGWGLKYITQYADAAKPNRIYIPGDRIHSTWSDTEHDYALNEENGDWYRIVQERPIKEGYKKVTGAYIVQRYLQDDLWETDKIDSIFNQAAFLLAKIIPTSYMRSSTMGTAGTWKLLMAAWSYEHKLGIPNTETKRDFTGGLSRLLVVGYSKGVVKMDYAGLYPKTQLTHSIFPELDISGVMEGMLTYVVDKRDKFKFLAGDHKAKSKEKGISIEEKSYHEKLASLYDKKQLPLKILANSWFGAYGAPYIFNWGETDCAEETTCRGRQYLRLMIKYLVDKYGFKPLVGDTDGFNFTIPENINNVKYIAKGSHWKTEGKGGIELTGLDAVLAEFNETQLTGRMGLDIDDIYTSTINFSRKNYANLVDGKIKLVGNTIKSKKLPTYIEEFIDEGIKLLLNGDGYKFIELYYEYVDKIFNYKIPLAKIASKSKIKTTIEDYKKNYSKKNKAGKPMPKQAHMELVIKENVPINLGDTIYYVNTGTKKSDGDLKSIKNESNGRTEVVLNCKLVDNNIIENNPEYIEDSYNVAKYLAAFNKRIKPLLVCFSPEIREVEKVVRGKIKKVDNILIDITVDKKTGQMILDQRKHFTEKECELTSGFPFEEGDQDDYIKDLLMMEDKEIRFWTSVNRIPNHMEENEWNIIKEDYFKRLELEKENGIIEQKNTLLEIFKKLEVEDLDSILNSGIIPMEILMICDLNEENDGIYLKSRKWEVNLYPLSDIFSFYDEADARKRFYIINPNKTYEDWLNYKSEQESLTGNPMIFNSNKINITNIDKSKNVVISEFVPVSNNNSDGEEDEDDEYGF